MEIKKILTTFILGNLLIGISTVTLADNITQTFYAENENGTFNTKTNIVIPHTEYKVVTLAPKTKPVTPEKKPKAVMLDKDGFLKKTFSRFNIKRTHIPPSAAIDLPSSSSANQHWSITASLGYTEYQQAYQGDGQTALGRLAIDKTLFIRKHTTFGLELGVQSGNSMRLDAPQATLDVLGGLPIQSTVKPILDVLATAKTEVLGNSLVFAQVKGGIAYRRWQFDDRTSVNSLSNIAGELQAGFGIALSQIISLSLLYQGIYGGNPNFTVNATNETGHVSTIPIQQGALLSFSVMG